MRHSAKHLKKIALFRKLIEEHGLPRFERNKTPFEALTRAIIYQQISGKAAASIYKKFLTLFGDADVFPSPSDVLQMNTARMRSAGLSTQKVTYIKDLAQKFLDGTINHEQLHTLSNEDVVAALTQVKGIGVWTVHMFLIFTLQRPDLLPTGDLGIQKGFQTAFKLRTLPTHTQMEKLARPWRAHASLASWYLWRVADTVKEKKVSRLKKSRPRAK